MPSERLASCLPATKWEQQLTVNASFCPSSGAGFCFVFVFHLPFFAERSPNVWDAAFQMKGRSFFLPFSSSFETKHLLKLLSEEVSFWEGRRLAA